MDGIKYFYASILQSPCYINQRVAHLRRKPNGKLCPYYTTFVLNNTVGQYQLMREMTIATTVGHITNMSISKMAVPTISESFHDEISGLIKGSIGKIEESKRLLEQAKTRVEKLIEEAIAS